MIEKRLLFIIESTGSVPVKDTWRIFTTREIVDLFPEVDLKVIGVFEDAYQERTVFVGESVIALRKNLQNKYVNFKKGFIYMHPFNSVRNFEKALAEQYW